MDSSKWKNIHIVDTDNKGGFVKMCPYDITDMYNLSELRCVQINLKPDTYNLS